MGNIKRAYIIVYDVCIKTSSASIFMGEGQLAYILGAKELVMEWPPSLFFPAVQQEITHKTFGRGGDSNSDHPAKPPETCS